MENSTPILERLSVVDRNPLVNFMKRYDPMWDSLLGMLRPMDIVSLAIATQFRLRPTEAQIQIYMKWWRQIFHDMKWVDRFPNFTIPAEGFQLPLPTNTFEILIIGKDLNRLDYAIKSWDYFDTKEIRLLVVVQGTLRISERDEAIRALLASIDTSYMWGIEKYQVQVQAALVQTCIVFNKRGYIHLCRSWEKSVLELVYVIDGIPGLQSFKVWYASLRMPNFMISQNTLPAVVLDQILFSRESCSVRI